MLKKINSLFNFLLISLVSLTFVSAAVNVIDVAVTENVYQEIEYNPLGASSGLWVGAGENQTAYNLTGEIVIKNMHSTEAVQDIVVNITNISNIYNLGHLSGNAGFVSAFNQGSDFAILYVGDLGPGQNSTFSYQINGSNIESPLDIAASYAPNVFAGSSFPVTEVLTNRLNSTNYPINCVYDINVTENTAEISGAGNFTFDNSSLTGGDASNASIDATNKTLSWNVLAKSCLNADQSANVSYTINAPLGVATSDDYDFTNSTISYRLNTSISRVNVSNIAAITDLELEFEKYQVNVLTGDNATWRITAEAFSTSDISVNLTEVTFWVSQRNGTGTGFTNPSLRDNDTISGAELFKAYNPNVLLNSTTGNWNNTGSEWLFNYTFSSSPIVWMDLDNEIISDGVQLTDRQVTYGADEIYIKEIYVATGYWLEIKKNITRIADSEYNVLITVRNLGSSPTPFSQVVMVYNFIPNLFNLTSSFVYSASTWYNSDATNETLNDPTYNGTMFQYALTPATNPYNSSLDAFGGSSNSNNTWTVEYNISGTGDFNFDDLFLTGVDPLQVQEVGTTPSLFVQGAYKVVSSNVEYILSGLAILIAALVFLF